MSPLRRTAWALAALGETARATATRHSAKWIKDFMGVRLVFRSVVAVIRRNRDRRGSGRPADGGRCGASPLLAALGSVVVLVSVVVGVPFVVTRIDIVENDASR